MKKVFHTRIYPLHKMIGGKKVVVNFRGYFTLEENGPRQWRSLGTPNRQIAEKRIAEIALQAQRVQEGLEAPDAQKNAAAKPLLVLVTDYKAYLASRGRARKHVHDTIARLEKMVRQIRWRAVSEIQPGTFETWQTALTCSAKTKKEYQVSLSAFLNWLVTTGRLTHNVLAKLEKIDTRGQQVRHYRSYTEDELARLFAAAEKYCVGYQALLYTSKRWSEVHALTWGDLTLDGDPQAIFREGTTKDKDKSVVPLSRPFAAELRALRHEAVLPSERVFAGRLADYDLFRKHLQRAGIQHKDAAGNVLNLHSFRKTFQTLGVRYGMNQRVAQEILGHSDANLTAKVYTDVAALGLRGEIEKLPWITGAGVVAQPETQKSGIPSPAVSLNDIISKVAGLIKAAGSEQLSHLMSLSDISGHTGKLGAGAGFEPATFRLPSEMRRTHVLHGKRVSFSGARRRERWLFEFRSRRPETISAAAGGTIFRTMDNDHFNPQIAHYRSAFGAKLPTILATGLRATVLR